ncbi:cation transporter [Sphingomonas sp. Leaf339]|uniref:cation diffusion facilitator family transporter n=1 Tax=Sphingomonas sp. Leaf339 TaxID=1736343 RepID=UPI0006F517F5|nr:cation diffusion facilitator family transporter [Sphingomonas sp. Leaf339]KQU56035.1 cation transporter [Sphingomonas sp. Leaf339]
MAGATIGKTIRSNIVLFGALFANVGIAIAKFVAAGLTGSSSMLSEGFHSLVDSGNQILLLYGQRRAKRPADIQHPFGYGRELYFWAFVVAILVFALGAGISFYEGWLHIQSPEPLRDPTVNYMVLGIAFLLEGSSWAIAVREFSQTKGKIGWWDAVKASKDPASFIVLFEDSAALAGLLVAALGIWVSHHWSEPRIDGVASLVIGVILAAVAGLLAREAKGLLIGERANPDVVERVRSVVAASDGITAVNHVRTIHTAPESVFVAISADFADHLTMGEGEALIGKIETALRDEFPEISSVYVRPEKVTDSAGRGSQLSATSSG